MKFYAAVPMQVPFAVLGVPGQQITRLQRS